LDMQIETKVSIETGLMLEHILSTKALGVTSKSHSIFSVIEINGDIDESLFSIDVLGKETRHADITEMIRDGMSPFDRNVGASNN
jgi:hypothetical protein